MRAAPLDNLPDWYIVEQLKHFKSGMRGADPKDVIGQVMATQAQTMVGSEQDMIDIAEYIKSLSKK